MKKFVLIFLGTLLLTANLILLSTRNTTAQSAGFFNVAPFVTQAGRMGFFNQEDGMIYIYDSDVKNLLFVAQLNELGQPIEQLNVTNNNVLHKTSKSIIIPTDDKDDE